MKRVYLLVIPLVLVFCGAISAQAQIRANAIGVKAGLYFDNSLPMLGVNGEIPLTAEFDFEPAAELVFGISHTTRLVVDANGRYSFTFQGSDVRPFVLGGLGLVFDFVNTGIASDSRTDFRLNLGGGAVFNARSTTQFWAGLKVAVLSKNTSDVLLQGGVNFYL